MGRKAWINKYTQNQQIYHLPASRSITSRKMTGYLSSLGSITPHNLIILLRLRELLLVANRVLANRSVGYQNNLKKFMNLHESSWNIGGNAPIFHQISWKFMNKIIDEKCVILTLTVTNQWQNIFIWVHLWKQT